ncbi:MAG: hypothetical protein M3O71_14670 [Bacteroidota bacterium]|nr:hypothetical protein [Bacteroidota bacterium]
MKTLTSFFVILIIAATFTACSKSGDNPGKVTAATPLIKAMAFTTFSGRSIFNCTYDDKKRLTSTGFDNNVNPITYNLGGFQIVNTTEANKKKVIDFSLENGRIKSSIYNVFINQVNQYLPVNSVFSYDARGRLIKIQQTITLDAAPPYPSRTIIYTFTWDDNDNLIGSSFYDPARPESKYEVAYSGFSAENVNTLTGKNFGFDYFGTTSYTSQFNPGGDGSSGGILPFIYPGKILPSVWRLGNFTLNYTYHKNAQGYIDRIEETDTNDPNDFVYTDIAYQ